ncbi:nuclear transport factor 2 family protein [Streptomyces sp. CA-111067]|uniref:nuclear transport factor 2 family protein n=1 Tax=Streptomyces sp. CA-111067 TaxID=3240046 RepID=UPI003D99CC0C
MPTAPTPRAVFERLASLLSSGSWTEIAALYAEDAVVDIPFALPAPDRVEGRAALHERFSTVGARALDITVDNITVHETADPEVIVAAFDYRGRALTTGRAFHVTNLQVLRVRDGLIAASTDYHDHVALAVATGHQPALEEALGAGGTPFSLDRASG